MEGDEALVKKSSYQYFNPGITAGLLGDLDNSLPDSGVIFPL